MRLFTTVICLCCCSLVMAAESPAATKKLAKAPASPAAIVAENNSVKSSLKSDSNAKEETPAEAVKHRLKDWIHFGAALLKGA